MKIIAICITCLSLVGINAITKSNLNWHTNVESAQKKALKESKPLLIYFTGSDWCGPCKSLSTDFFESKAFENISDQFILVKLDIPRRLDIISEKAMTYNKEKLSELNPSKKFPTLIAFNKKGKEIDRISSYSGMGDPSSYFNFVERVLGK